MIDYNSFRLFRVLRERQGGLLQGAPLQASRHERDGRDHLLGTQGQILHAHVPLHLRRGRRGQDGPRRQEEHAAGQEGRPGLRHLVKAAKALKNDETDGVAIDDEKTQITKKIILGFRHLEKGSR